MADRLRIVERDGPRRPTVVMDLQDGDGYRLTRDTFAITPPPPKVRSVQSGERYGGSHAVGSAHENAALGATWLVKGATVDEALRRAEALVAQAESALSGPWRFIEWKSELASYPTYWQRRGPAAWAPTYKWVQMTQAHSWEFQVTWPVEPLGRWDPMDVYDDFAVDSRGDYTAGVGTAAMPAPASGVVVPPNNALYLWLHTGRGYAYEDVQVTQQFHTGGAKAGNVQLVLKWLDDLNYIYVDASDGTVSIGVVTGGVVGTTGGSAVAARATGTDYWVRARIEGNVVTGEVFSSDPTPMGAPLGSTSLTLTGADATAFGVGVSGRVAMRGLIGNSSGWSYGDFAVEPFTYRNRTLPDKLVLGGPVPGTAPALCDVEVTPSGGAAAPAFALLGWNYNRQNDTAAYYPFGVVDSAAMTANGLTTTTDANARGGNLLTADTGSLSSPQGPYVSHYLHMMEPDEFTPDEVALEVWARVRIASTVANPRLVVSVIAGLPVSPPRAYAEGYESLGKPLPAPSSGTAYRFVRVGVVRLYARPVVPYRLDAQLSWGGASSGLLGLDALFMVPATRRASSPTGKALGTSYPRFLATTSQQLRRIAADLTGWLSPPETLYRYLGAYRAPGLGGSPITLTPTAGAGRQHLAVKLSSLVPDDPTVDATTEQKEHAATVHAAVTPRSFAARG